MAAEWSRSFRVGSSQDADQRWTDVTTGSNWTPPQGCEADVQKAHDMAWGLVADGAVQKPYAVYLNGIRDLNSGSVGLQVTIDTNV